MFIDDNTNFTEALFLSLKLYLLSIDGRSYIHLNFTSW